MKITTKIIASAICVLALVLGLLLMLNYFKFSKILADTTNSRLSVITQSIGDSIEGALKLGLPLDEIRLAPQIIARAKGLDPAITRIDVFDKVGGILFSTDPVYVKREVDENILNNITEIRDARADIWNADSDSAFVTGMTVYNGADRAVGGMVMQYDKSGYHTKVASVLRSLLISTVVVFGAVASFLTLGILFGFKELSHSYASMETSLKGVLSSDPTQISQLARSDEFAAQLNTIVGKIDGVSENIQKTQSGPTGSVGGQA